MYGLIGWRLCSAATAVFISSIGMSLPFSWACCRWETGFSCNRSVHIKYWNVFTFQLSLLSLRDCVQLQPQCSYQVLECLYLSAELVVVERLGSAATAVFISSIGMSLPFSWACCRWEFCAVLCDQDADIFEKVLSLVASPAGFCWSLMQQDTACCCGCWWWTRWMLVNVTRQVHVARKLLHTDKRLILRKYVPLIYICVCGHWHLLLANLSSELVTCHKMWHFQVGLLIEAALGPGQVLTWSQHCLVVEAALGPGQVLTWSQHCTTQWLADVGPSRAADSWLAS